MNKNNILFKSYHFSSNLNIFIITISIYIIKLLAVGNNQQIIMVYVRAYLYKFCFN